MLFTESMPWLDGNVPRASCKLLITLLFALEELSRFGFTKERLVYRDVLQMLNRPHLRKSRPFDIERIMPDEEFSEKLAILEIFYLRNDPYAK